MGPGQFRRFLFLLAALSILCFITAAIVDPLSWKLGFGFTGALLPAIGSIGVAVWRRVAWKGMGRDLGFKPLDNSAFPDFVGFRDGKRILVGRRPELSGPVKEVTFVRMQGKPELRLPGLVTNARSIHDLMLSLDPTYDDESE